MCWFKCHFRSLYLACKRLTSSSMERFNPIVLFFTSRFSRVFVQVVFFSSLQLCDILYVFCFSYCAGDAASTAVNKAFLHVNIIILIWESIAEKQMYLFLIRTTQPTTIICMAQMPLQLLPFDKSYINVVENGIKDIRSIYKFCHYVLWNHWTDRVQLRGKELKSKQDFDYNRCVAYMYVRIK